MASRIDVLRDTLEESDRKFIQPQVGGVVMYSDHDITMLTDQVLASLKEYLEAGKDLNKLLTFLDN